MYLEDLKAVLLTARPYGFVYDMYDPVLFALLPNLCNPVLLHYLMYYAPLLHWSSSLQSSSTSLSYALLLFHCIGFPSFLNLLSSKGSKKLRKKVISPLLSGDVPGRD